jgi:hypothetical protein
LCACAFPVPAEAILRTAKEGERSYDFGANGSRAIMQTHPILRVLPT